MINYYFPKWAFYSLPHKDDWWGSFSNLYRVNFVYNLRMMISIGENGRTEAIHLGKLNNNRQSTNFGDCWAIFPKKKPYLPAKKQQSCVAEF